MVLGESIANTTKEDSWDYWTQLLDESLDQVSSNSNYDMETNYDIVYFLNDESVYKIKAGKDQMVFKVNLAEGDILTQDQLVRTFELEYERGNPEYFDNLVNALEDNIQGNYRRHSYRDTKSCDFVFPKASEKVF